MPNAKQYAKYKEKWSLNEEEYIKEKERINRTVKERYANDIEYRNKCIQYQRERQLKLKEKKITLIN